MSFQRFASFCRKLLSHCTSRSGRALPGRLLVVLLAAGLVAGCATPGTDKEDADAEEAASAGGTLGQAVGVSGSTWSELCVPQRPGGFRPDDLAWEVFRVPGKQPTQYSHVKHDGREAVLAAANTSGSILRHRQRVEVAELGRVRFSWNVPPPTPAVNQSLPGLEDVPVRVVLQFEGDRGRFSAKNAMLSELSLLLTGEKLPFATLVYSWSRVDKPGDVLVNERTDRIRKLVVQSGDQGYNQWINHERDVRADYLKAFGEEPGALLSFAVFTEGEKGEGPLQAFYGPLNLLPAATDPTTYASQQASQK
jgi:Protein of unknown function (DUF3047)